MRNQAGLMVLVALSLSCTDVTLYAASGAPLAEANRFSLTGTLCADIPDAHNFPVKALFIVDSSSAIRTMSANIYQQLQTSEEDVFQTAAVRDLSFAFVSMGPTARSLTSDGFVQGADLVPITGELASDLTSNGPGRDFVDAFSIAETLIASDLSTTSRGDRQLTRYVVALFTSGPPTPALDATGQKALAQSITGIQQLISSEGAGQVSFQVYYWPPAGGGVGDSTYQYLTDLVASASGTVNVTPSSGFDFAATDLEPLATPFVHKQLLIWNRNVRATGGQLQVDSDGDGLPDDFERQIGSDPTNPDTDGDGISDGVEYFLIPSGRHVLIPDPTPNCENFATDTDGDGLTDCEEMLLGTDPSLPDTDGDGLPDLVEFIDGTNFLQPDADLDDDGDGTTNGQEVLIHSDPWTSDLTLQADNGYRYREAVETGAEGQDCVDATVANIGVMQTLDGPGRGGPGLNQIYIWLMLAPEGSISTPGIARLAVLPVRLDDGRRTPPGASISVADTSLALLK